MHSNSWLDNLNSAPNQAHKQPHIDSGDSAEQRLWNPHNKRKPIICKEFQPSTNKIFLSP